MRLPDLEAWAIFAKVAELGSFTRAAQELALSKGTVSKAVTRLEERLGAPLLARTSRKLSLTQTGLMAQERAARILAEGEAIEAEAAQTLAKPRGLVRLTAPVTFGLHHLASAIPAFMARYPDVQVELMLDDKMVDLVGDGFDLAVRITSLADSSLRARKLCSVHRPLVATPDYLERFGTPKHPQELKDHHCLIYTNVASPHTWRFTTKGQADEVLVNVSGSLRSNNAEILREGLLAHMGLAILPDFAVWHLLEQKRVVAILPEWKASEIALHLVTPPGKLRPARVSVLIDFLAQHFARPVWSRKPE